MSALFSEDKSHLLIGDSGGGIHVLSSGPCADPEPAEMDFIYQATSSRARPSLGITLANQLLATNELSMHPVYGPVQGPEYAGPFARWARGALKPMQNINNVPLLERYQLRQFQGPPVKDRHQLSGNAKAAVQRYFQTAGIRHAQYAKRPENEQDSNFYNANNTSNPSSDSKRPSLAVKKRKTVRRASSISNREMAPIITKIDTEMIDLTGDSDGNHGITEFINLTGDLEVYGPPPCRYKRENLEEDYWWPDSRCVEANIPS